MNEEEIIASGILELYVCGSLSDEDTREVEVALDTFPNLKKEIEIIESSLITLAENVSPPLATRIWTCILNAIRPENKDNRLTTEEKSFNWASVTGWAAAILLLGGLFWAMNQKSTLEDKVDFTTTENTKLEDQLQNSQNELLETENILAVLRSDAYNTVILPGNEAVAPEASAKVFYNKEEGIAYIDAKSLPTPPKGKVYQVWSLIMEPLTPSSMGLLEGLSAVQTDLYKFEEFPIAEGFGITLEPEGGSETPTLSQLYVLGTVSQP